MNQMGKDRIEKCINYGLRLNVLYKQEVQIVKLSTGGELYSFYTDALQVEEEKITNIKNALIELEQQLDMLII